MTKLKVLALIAVATLVPALTVAVVLGRDAALDRTALLDSVRECWSCWPWG